MPPPWHQPADLLQVEAKVWRAASLRCQATAVDRRGKPQTQKAGGRPGTGQHGFEGDALKKVLKPKARRSVVTEMMKSFGLSQRRVCRLSGWNRSSIQFRPQPDPDRALRERMKQWAIQKPSWGCPILHDMLKAEGLVINHKRSERIYREEKLALKRRRRRKLPSLERVPLEQACGPNQRWSMDFVHDQLAAGRCFRSLTIVEDFTRQCLAIEVDTSLGGARVVEVLERLALQIGLPKTITTDNGPEFTGKALHLWAQASGVHLHHIQPGKPTQNAFVESFNGTFRQDCLNQHWFDSVAQAQLLIEHWRKNEYNSLRPHSSIGRITPDAFAALWNNQQNITKNQQQLYPTSA